MTGSSGTAATCTSSSGCPSVADLGDEYLVIGATTMPEHAAVHGGNVGDGETAVAVPKPVIDDAVAGPLKARIAELEAELAEARKDQEWLGFLEEAGVDNSPAYDYACQLRREARAAVAAEAGEPRP